ncbi:hypothetical protein FA95DRAFT_1571781 [Auriscalpium vulgare]|uniref:Uncharacterized protein n=1 Tax=Auriscalpium vulgare TaxID=40419 RepID=A0ACB8RWL7_9AGAM|nr:hypothetical protein FA95DRAFT_1571781 [Auriscalpium vulgare]
MNPSSATRISELEGQLRDASISRPERSLNPFGDDAMTGPSGVSTEDLKTNLAASRRERKIVQNTIRQCEERLVALKAKERVHDGEVARLENEIRKQAQIAAEEAAKALKRLAGITGKTIQATLKEALEHDTGQKEEFDTDNSESDDDMSTGYPAQDADSSESDIDVSPEPAVNEKLFDTGSGSDQSEGKQPAQPVSLPQKRNLADLPSHTTEATNKRQKIVGPSTAAAVCDFLQARVATVAHVAVPEHAPPPPPQLHQHSGYIRRDFLRQIYSTGRKLLSKVPGKRNIPRSTLADRFLLFPQWAQSPGLPDAPGKPGTLISNREDIARQLSLFVRPRDNAAVWKYMGNYELRLAKPLSAEEFKALPEKTRKEWARVILKAPEKCYMAMRARICLRKDGCAITDEAIEKFRQPAGMSELEPPDAIAAIESGEVVLKVFLCIPLSYEDEFQSALMTEYHQWEQTMGQILRRRDSRNSKRGNIVLQGDSEDECESDEISDGEFVDQ